MCNEGGSLYEDVSGLSRLGFRAEDPEAEVRSCNVLILGRLVACYLTYESRSTTTQLLYQ
jgi:hypothetical protein